VMGRAAKIEMTFFIAVEGETWAIWGEWPAALVQIQCFDFGSRWEVTG
jgi:hypothetical protein